MVLKTHYEVSIDKIKPEIGWRISKVGRVAAPVIYFILTPGSECGFSWD